MNPVERYYSWPSQIQLNKEARAKFLRNKNTPWHGKGKGR